MEVRFGGYLAYVESRSKHKRLDDEDSIWSSGCYVLSLACSAMAPVKDEGLV